MGTRVNARIIEEPSEGYGQHMEIREMTAGSRDTDIMQSQIMFMRRKGPIGEYNVGLVSIKTW